MRGWMGIPLLLASAAAVAAGGGTAFNGKDLTGWSAINGAQPGHDVRETKDIWKVRDGTLVCVGLPGSWSLLQTARD